MKTMKTIVPVILCGGSGTRLWPMSREQMPKQFLRLMGNHSLLQETALRAIRTAEAAPEHVVVVTLAAMEPLVRLQMGEINPLLTRHILSEPMARNTAAAVAMAALYVREKFGPDAIMWILPADHHIADEKALSDAFAHALTAAESDYLVTFGIEPTRVETGYGYIEMGTTLNLGEKIHQVSKFIEKPGREQAEALIAAGNNLWNSGMFLFRAETVLKSFEAYAPDVGMVIQQLKSEIILTAQVSADHYVRVPEQPFDKAVMEKSDRIAVVPCNIGWSDIGSWESLWELKDKDDQGNALHGDAIAINSKNVMVKAQNRLIACVGVEDIVVIDTGDALLVMNKRNSDGLKTVVTQLKANQRGEVKSLATAEDSPVRLTVARAS